MGYSRLDDRYIEDDIFRALFHQEMIKRVSEYHSDNFQYTIKIDEVYRSDLAAYRAYGNADLRWVFRCWWAMSQKWKKCPPGPR